MFICAYMYTCVCVYIYIYISIYRHVCVYIYVYIHIYLDVHICICLAQVRYRLHSLVLENVTFFKIYHKLILIKTPSVCNSSTLLLMENPYYPFTSAATVIQLAAATLQHQRQSLFIRSHSSAYCHSILAVLDNAGKFFS